MLFVGVLDGGAALFFRKTKATMPVIAAANTKPKIVPAEMPERLELADFVEVVEVVDFVVVGVYLVVSFEFWCLVVTLETEGNSTLFINF